MKRSRLTHDKWPPGTKATAASETDDSINCHIVTGEEIDVQCLSVEREQICPIALMITRNVSD